MNTHPIPVTNPVSPEGPVPVSVAEARFDGICRAIAFIVANGETPVDSVMSEYHQLEADLKAARARLVSEAA